MIKEELIFLKLKANSKELALEQLCELVKDKLDDPKQFLADLKAREGQENTALDSLIALPHAKSLAVKEEFLALGVFCEGVAWNENARVKLVFLLGSKGSDAHIKTMSFLAQKLMQEGFKESLLGAKSRQEAMRAFGDLAEAKTTEASKTAETSSSTAKASKTAKASTTTEASSSKSQDAKQDKPFLIALTGCPAGIAHTYLAASSLEAAAIDLELDIKVETHGSIGVQNQISPDEIKRAKAVIIACELEVDIERFAGLPLIRSSVKEPINDARSLINKAFEAPIYKGKNGLDKSSTAIKAEAANGSNSANSSNASMYRYLMSGVSYMIPFVVTGGLLIALSLALGGEPTPEGMQIPEGSLWNKVLDIGVVAFKFMIPVLSAFIASAISSRAALAPGFVVGHIANDGSFYGAQAGTGFIGAIIAGLLVGYFVKYLLSINYHKMLAPLLPILIAPIAASLLIGAVFIFIIGAPIASMMDALNSMLVGLSGANLVLLGIVIGGMAGFDMGGPVNKVAFLFCVGMIASGQTQFMGAMACAIPVAPLGMFLASFLGKGLFKKEEQEAGKASGAMGLVGISEGAIPFAAQDPLAVIPANVIGSMLAAVLAFLFGLTCSVAHGGPIVALLGAMNKPFLALLCMLAGAVLTAFVAIALKRLRGVRA